jgi:HK97 family phage major capsid protein
MSRDEIFALDLDGVEARSAELSAEMTEDGNLEAFESEIAMLEERKGQILEERAAQKAATEAVINGEGETIKETIIEEKRTMTDMEIRNSKEYINAFAEYIKSGDDTECRALLTENASGTVAVPELVYDIVKNAWEREGIMSRVRKAYLKGNLKVGFELSADPAYIHTEGSGAVTTENLVLGTVSIVPESIKKSIQISDEALDLRGEAFLQWVYDELAYRIAKKAADTLVAKIVAAGTASTSTAVGVPAITATTVSMGTIAGAIAQLSDEAANPVIIMNKLTYPVFKAVQYANGYGADPFEGLPVIFNNSLAAHGAATTGVCYAIVGDLGEGALANFPNGEEIQFKMDDVSLADADLVKITGREYVGLGIIGPQSFVKLIK